VRSRSRRVAAFALLAALALPAACGGGASDNVELSEDPSDETVAGPLPTAPPDTVGDGQVGLGPDANALLGELDRLRDETDLCRILTGAAFESLLERRFDPAGLVTNPAGLARLLTSIDAVVTHVVEIAPPEIAPSMQTVEQVWRRIVALDPEQPDVQAQVSAILAEPGVVEANQAVLTWGVLNCTPPT
jgi:hypothetical protein